MSDVAGKPRFPRKGFKLISSISFDFTLSYKPLKQLAVFQEFLGMDSLRTILRSLTVFDPQVSKPLPASQQETPKETSKEAELYVQNILRIYGELSTRSELKPCPDLNKLFGELVGYCTTTLNEATTKAVGA